MTRGPFAGWFYDGHTADSLRVDLLIQSGDMLVLAPDGSLVLRTPVADVQLSEPFRNSPRLVNFRGGESLQIDDAREVTRALGLAGRPPPLVARLQGSWPLTLVATILVVALFVFAYVRGVPAVAHWAANALPPAVEQRMGTSLLELLDNRQLRPSKLPEAKQTRIAKRFGEMAATVAPNAVYRLEFRTAKQTENRINAFALPGGIIVLLDGLVNAAANDDQVIAVLGHELGHVVHRHSMQRLVQAVGLGGLAGLAWGDFSGVAANVPLLLGIFRYSRADERTADEFGVRMLREGGLTAQPLLEFFELLESKHGKRAAEIPDFLSTHPSTAERIEWLRSQLDATR